MRRLALPSLIAVLAACSSPKAEPGIPITGFIDSANGTIAPLTAANRNTGTGFNITATLGSDQLLISNATWTCYTPAPPQYPNFDIEATDGQTYLFAISIQPGYWTPGVKTIDGETVVVAVATGDRAVIATTGLLTLTSAGTAADTAGHYCKFDLDDLPVFGERDPE